MHIQYVGFHTAGIFRIYTFHVIDVPHEVREFTVKIQSEEFRPNRLKLQDGPGISYGRLAQELRRQLPESHMEACLIIGERDIADYLEQQHPKKW
jgi:hypothetical protein